MKNYKKIFIVILFSIICCFGIFSYFNLSDGKLDNRESREDIVNRKVDELMSNMTLEEKIGQMIVINYNISEVNEELRSLLEDVKPGGFILMQNNYSTFDATRKFVNDIKSYSSLPFIVATDQEGGRVQRLQLLTDVEPTYVPPMSDVGDTNDIDIAYDVGKVIAEEVRTLGINVVFAPVVDVFSNIDNTVIGNRSFGSDTDIVTRLALSVSKGLEDNGVVSTFKHFPGHGDTSVDSHSSLPIIYKSYEEIDSQELIPFKSAILNGTNMIMTAHIALPNITGDNTPSTMSKEIVTGILRDKLGFDGIVISDALNMKALTNNYSDEEIYIKTVSAGVDILLMPRDARLAVESIKNNISEDRINESVRRILKFKFMELEDNNVLDISYLGSEEHQQIIDRIN